MDDFLSFRKFITPMVIKIVYIVYSIGVALGAIGLVIASTASGGFVGFLGGLIGGAVFLVIGLIAVRISFELIYVFFGIYEAVQEMRKTVAPGSVPQGFAPVMPVEQTPPPPPAV